MMVVVVVVLLLRGHFANAGCRCGAAEEEQYPGEAMGGGGWLEGWVVQPVKPCILHGLLISFP
jgi:hypothetical protein